MAEARNYMEYRKQVLDELGIEYVTEDIEEFQKWKEKLLVGIAYLITKGDMTVPVAKWLDAHPEATTSVEDGSLTEAKFDDELKLKAIKDYATPEMYGAKGDGVTDDTVAIQSVLNSGRDVIGRKKYKIASSINISGKDRVLDFSNSDITYTGDNYAFIFSTAQNIQFSLKTLNCANGNGIKLISNNVNNYVQYININAIALICEGNCIYGEASGEGWVNEIRINNMRISGDSNGIYLNNLSNINTMNHWNFTNVGFEGIETAVKMAAVKEIKDILFIGCRYNENLTKLIESTGAVIRVLFIGSGLPISANLFNCDSNANNWRFIASDDSAFDSAIYRGKLLTQSVKSYFAPIILTANDDLNDCVDVGLYGCYSGSVASTLSNCPYSANGFTLDVSLATGILDGSYIYILQTLVGAFGDVRYARRGTYNGSTWAFSEWKLYADGNVQTGTVTAGTSITITDAGRTFVKRWGHVVQLGLALTASAAINAWKTIATLPDFAKGVSTSCTINGKRYYINTDGSIVVGEAVASGENINISFTFII